MEGTRDALICNFPSQTDYSTGKAIAVSELVSLFIFGDGFESGDLSRWSSVARSMAPEERSARADRVACRRREADQEFLTAPSNMWRMPRCR